jgi:hypothetical protein
MYETWSCDYCDIQPPTNRRILLAVRELGGSLGAWTFKIMKEGLEAFEELQNHWQENTATKINLR